MNCEIYQLSYHFLFQCFLYFVCFLLDGNFSLYASVYFFLLLLFSLAVHSSSAVATTFLLQQRHHFGKQWYSGAYTHRIEHTYFENMRKSTRDKTKRASSEQWHSTKTKMKRICVKTKTTYTYHIANHKGKIATKWQQKKMGKSMLRLLVKGGWNWSFIFLSFILCFWSDTWSVMVGDPEFVDSVSICNVWMEDSEWLHSKACHLKNHLTCAHTHIP